MAPVPLGRQSRQQSWRPEVRESDDWHSTGEYVSAIEVFSTRQEADRRVAELEALPGMPVEEQTQQKPKQKNRAYGACKRKKALKSKAVKRQKKPDLAAA